jgi:two-component system sensor kinase FixL
VAEAWLGPLGQWKSRRLVILAIFGAIVGEAILISVLFVERFSRQKAEKSFRQSQDDRFRLLVESSPNGIVLIDGSHRIVLVNECAEKLFGYCRKELIGQAFDILVPDRFREHAIHPAQFLAAPMAPLTGGRREIFGCRKDGSEFPIEIGVSPIRTSEGLLVLTTIIDISGRKRAEAEARQYRDELAHISRAETLGEIAASLAHELNQPLTGIMNNANAGRRFMAKGADMRKLDSLFEAVVADARRAGEIIRGIRDMVKKGEGSLRTVNLNNIITETARIIHSDALERHCVISTELDPKIPLVTANPIQLQQVLLNIIINAFDAMRETPMTKRRVIIRSEHDADGQVQVRVRDFGSGLPAENPSRIFEQFYSTKRDGLGMGLAIARSIIAAHKGEMQAENAKGGGTCVSFLLPRVRKELV